ncbi:MAG: hypothetical protein JXA52_02055 [Planctomycetes bacterium]|nr:hypothetical protein [Planctomycetota bacterium]
MEKSLEVGKLMLNRERGVFLVIAALCAWQVVSYFVQPPPRPEIGDPYVKSGKPEGEIFTLAEPDDIQKILSTPGYDVFVPRSLLQQKEAVAIVRPPEGGKVVRPPKSEVDMRRELELFGQGTGIGRFADEVPPLPMSTSQNAAPARVPVQEAYLFPLKVKGWIMPAEGETIKVMVLPAGGGEPFCLAAGESWGDLRVQTITPEMVEFVNQEGKIIYIDKEMLLKERRLANSEEGEEEEEDEEETGVVDKILEKLNLSDSDPSKLDEFKNKADLF